MEMFSLVILLLFLFTALPTFALIWVVVLIVINPEKLEKWASLLYKLFVKAGLFVGWSKRKYIQHDLQSRVNSFAKKAVRFLPQMALKKCSIKWVDSKEVDRRSFIDDDQVVLVMSSSDPDDHNFVHGAYHFVSTSMLSKVKKYISQSQRESLDLYVTDRIVKEEKLGVRDFFIEEYLHPGMQKYQGKALKYYTNYEKIDSAGVFYSVYLTELDLVGGRVYGKAQSGMVNIEIDSMIEFLLRYANRTIGEEIELHFEGENSCFAIVIIGKTMKLMETPEVYRKYINEKILPNGFKTVYMIGNALNGEFMDALADSYSGDYEILQRKDHDSLLNLRDGSTVTTPNHTVILLRKEASLSP